MVVKARPTGFVASCRVLVWGDPDDPALSGIPGDSLLFPHGPTEALRRAALKDSGIAGAILGASTPEALVEDVKALREMRPSLGILSLAEPSMVASLGATLGVASLADGSAEEFVRASCLGLSRLLLDVEDWGSRWWLTTREAELLARVACGTPKARVHTLMGVGTSTVDTWASSIVEKSDLASFTQAVDHVLG